MYRGIILACLSLLFVKNVAQAGIIKGRVTDKANGEPLPGAVVMSDDHKYGTTSDIDGYYSLSIPDGTYTIRSSYIGYKELLVNGVEVSSGKEIVLDFTLEEDGTVLEDAIVRAVKRQNTELAVIREQKESNIVQTAVSATQISKTQDKDASEVIRRVSGISIIDDKFVMVRGLSQRYNNVWINGGAVPSSEADSRAFSFDIIPAGQIDNMTIIKSPSPEYPADFSGGFITVATKQTVSKKDAGVQLGFGFNDQTSFRTFISGKGSSTDWLGFDSGLRNLKGGMRASLVPYSDYNTELDLKANGFNNDWTLRKRMALPEMKLSGNYSNSWKIRGSELSLMSALNYSNSRKRMTDMENSLYGPYDVTNDKPVILRKASDNQYTSDVRLGAMLNLSLEHGDSRYEWNNIFNQIGKDRYSERVGINAQPDNINNMEYYYSSRTTYNSQLRGKHSIAHNDFDWNVGYSYANHIMPDRRLIERTDRTDQKMGIYRIGREFTRLDEHVISTGANYSRILTDDEFYASVKGGIFGEYRMRDYRTRQFQYGWLPENKLPAGWLFDDDVQNNILIDSNYGPDKLYLYEEINFLNDYSASQAQAAGYAAADLRWKGFKAYIGLRYEYCRQLLKLNVRQYEESRRTTKYDYSDLFPSVNLTYEITKKHQLRAAYGRSTNRPEFRELSPSVFYDFDLGSSVMGNFDLKAAYIDNVDFRWEWYPSDGELISVALFYKHFRNPIEWTYTVSGGTDLIYSYINAKGANNYGVEIDIRKDFSFVGIPELSVVVNASFIRSRVEFEPGTNNIDRPMQGQSPYLVNAGLFYSNKGWNAAVLYNTIGKRIIGVGNRYGTASDGTSRNIPNSYEMPRHQIDLTLGKRIGKVDLKISARDILAQDYLFMQFEEIQSGVGTRVIEEVNRRYKPGRNFSFTIGYNF